MMEVVEVMEVVVATVDEVEVKLLYFIFRIECKDKSNMFLKPIPIA